VKAARWLAALRRGREGAADVLGMNLRNLGYIYPENPRRHFPIADDKLLCKEIMAREGIPTPRTHRVYRHFFELAALAKDLAPFPEFVIKPSQGSGGGGILVIAGRCEEGYLGVGGRPHSEHDLKKHLSDIIFGVHSFDLSDRAIIEERLHPHREVAALAPHGLADLRVILHRDRPVLAMTRLPTRASGGRANLHQGAVGVGVDLARGRTTHAVLKGEEVDRHPDTGEPLLDRQLPFWPQALDIAVRAARAVPLKYLGVDLALTPAGPMLLEINVRPGLEIQNANLAGLRALLGREAEEAP
jgi:alpha-L-glutamate ligase-like protein